MSDNAIIYKVVRPFWAGAHLLAAGEEIRLTAAEAKYRGSEIEPVEPALTVKRANKAAAVE